MGRRRRLPFRPVVPPCWQIDASRRSPYGDLVTAPDLAADVWRELASINERDPASLRLILAGLQERAGHAARAAAMTEWPRERGWELVHTLEAAVQLAAAVERLPRPPEGLVPMALTGDARWTLYLVLMTAGTARHLSVNPDEPCVDPVRQPELVPVMRALPPLERMFIPAFRALVEVARVGGALDEAAARLMGHRTSGHRASALAVAALGLLDTAVTRTRLESVQLAPFEAVEHLLRMRSTIAPVRRAVQHLDRGGYDVAGAIVDALARRWAGADPLAALAAALDGALGFAPKIAGDTVIDEAQRRRTMAREIPGLDREPEEEAPGPVEHEAIELWFREQPVREARAEMPDLAALAHQDAVLRRAWEIGCERDLSTVEAIAEALGMSRDSLERRRRRLKPPE